MYVDRAAETTFSRPAEERYGWRTVTSGPGGATSAGAELTVDHFQPRSKGGSDALDNLVYCCPACNEFKGDYWQLGSPRRILHPINDNPAEHFILTDDCMLQPLTETGEFHIARLHL